MEKAYEDTKIIKNYFAIISGKRKCYPCGKMTTVSGMALTEENTFSKHYPEADIIKSTGYDVCIVPWRDVFEQFPEKLQYYILGHYPVKPLKNASNYSTICEYCKGLQGNFYVYEEEGVEDTPFAYFSKEPLLLEEISLKSQIIELSANITVFKLINCYYMDRTSVKRVNSI